METYQITTMNDFNHIPNIGKKLAERLEKADITSFRHLTELGSEKAFIRLMTINEEACINLLFALEGAIQGIRWHNLSDNKKQELKEFYCSLKRI